MATQFKLVVPADKKEILFRLCHRQLKMGPAGRIRYLWFAVPEFRRGRQNFRQAVDYWWATVRELAPPQDREANELVLVLAELFPEVGGSHACQSVFTDAFLGEACNRDYSLPDEDWRGLRDMALARDTAGIRREIDRCLVGDLPHRSLMPLYQAAFRSWMDAATQVLRSEGHAALRTFLTEEVVPRYREYRRRGGEEHVRRFLNMLAHEAKVAAYTCYAAAWRGLIAMLHDLDLVDPASARFLWFWHGQQDNDDGQDVFRGAILALHPLSARIMTEPHYRHAIGAWLVQSAMTCPDPWTGDFQGDAYWLMVAAIQAAAREHVALRGQANLRRRKTRCA
ncbi:MAG: hypothetical protein ACYSUQ_06565 [Planctomycetota bacterium]|jgi:hypothetical protein